MFGSDKLSSIEETTVDVLLDIEKGGVSTSANIELNSAQLDSFLATLEDINKVSRPCSYGLLLVGSRATTIFSSVVSQLSTNTVLTPRNYRLYWTGSFYEGT